VGSAHRHTRTTGDVNGRQELTPLAGVYGVEFSSRVERHENRRSQDGASVALAESLRGTAHRHLRRECLDHVVARWVLIPRRRPRRMRVIMPAIIDQAGRPFNVAEADGISRRHSGSRAHTSPLITEGYPPVLVSSKLRVTEAIV
jgi:hypothetical protein